MPELVALAAVAARMGTPLAGAAFDVIMLAVLVAIPIWLFWWLGPGPIERNDAGTYIETAKQFLSGTAWTSVPDLKTSSEPLTLLRMPGYSLFLAGAMIIGGAHWHYLVLALQIIAAIWAGFVLYRTLAGLSGFRALGAAGAVIWMVTERGEFDRLLYTDSLYTSVLTILACRLIWLASTRSRPSSLDAFWLALGFATMSVVREFTVLMIGAGLPLFWLAFWQGGSIREPARRLGLVLAPTALVLVGVVAWNYARTGFPVLTTGAEDAPLFRLVQIEDHGTPIFTRDDPLDIEARPALKKHTSSEVREILGNLLQRHGLLAPQLASLVTWRYLETWTQHPKAMLREMVSDFQSAQATMAPLAFIDRKAQTYALNDYTPRFEQLLLLCVFVLPSAWLLTGLLFRPARRQVAVVLSTLLYCAVPVLAYLAIYFERRYALFAVGPLLAILAITAGGIGVVGRSMRLRFAASIPSRRDNPAVYCLALRD